MELKACSVEILDLEGIFFYHDQKLKPTVIGKSMAQFLHIDILVYKEPLLTYLLVFVPSILILWYLSVVKRKGGPF